MYLVVYSVKAKEFMKKLDKNSAERVFSRIDNLRNNPFPQDSKFIGRENGDKIFRYRIGDFRALYKIKENDKVVLIVKVDKRPRVYD